MPNLPALDPEKAEGKTRELFKAVQTKLGMVPNMMRTMGHSPAVLEGYLSFSGALGHSSIGARLAQQIALTVANANGCAYCNAAHSFISEKMVGIDPASIQQAREGNANDAKGQAALSFARTLVEKRGRVSPKDVLTLKEAGFTEAAITEIIAHTALNIFTNYFNNSAQTAVDFPEVELLETAEI